MSDTHKFFVATSDAALEDIRRKINAARGLPDDRTQTVFLPAAELPHDTQGRPILVIDAPLVDAPAFAFALAGVIASGAVWEITRQQYDAALPAPPPMP